MLGYSIYEVAEAVSGKLLIHSEKCVVTDLLIDSRKINSPADSIFFALVTKRNDGHKYIGTLIEKGVKCFCVNHIPTKLETKANYIVVKDTLNALQRLAEFHRQKFNIPVIGITGSNGKTIVKEWLWQLLSEEKTIIRSPQSYNSQIGVPLSVWQLEPIHQLAIFEAGISEPGEMEKLEPLIKPNIGILTNIGRAHDQFFESEDQKTSEKLKLFTDSHSIVYCRDYELIHSKIIKSCNVFNWGKHPDSLLRILEVEKHKKETIITALYRKEEQRITIHFTDEASFENAMHCWATMLLLGYGSEVIKNRMLKLQPVAMRLEMKEGINGCIIINDSYSSDYDSLANALDFLVQQTRHDKRTVILSDILQSSASDENLYKSVAGLLETRQISRLIGIGDGFSKNSHLFKMQKQFFNNTDQFLEQYNFTPFRNESILIKGARIFAFERIIDLLQQKSHETVLEVNLSALVHNLNFFRSLIKPKTKVMVMVKAFSYGSGSFEIANTLQFHHADYLAVAYADEGVELRKAGISLPILVMNPEMTGMEAMIRYDLEPEIYSFRTLQLFLSVIDCNDVNPNKIFKIHIKLDTGMHRLGFMEDEIDDLVVELNKNKNIIVSSVFSHLAASESKDLDWFTSQQIKNFEKMTWRLHEELGYSFMRHLLNSAGIIRHPYAQFDMVRLGISLYGISPLPHIQNKLEIVSRLKSVISQIKVIPQEEPVGYNCKWIAPRESTIAIVPVGYADGLSRKLSNGIGCMYVKNKIVPIIGNINMDMTIIDITGIDAEEGDEVIIFGKEVSISKLAELMDTIPYEVLTGISRRVKRVYFQE